MKTVLFAVFIAFMYIDIGYSADIIINGRSEIVVTGDMNSIIAEDYAEEQARNMAIEAGGSMLESKSTIVNNLITKDNIERVLAVTVTKKDNTTVKNYVVLSEKENLKKLYYAADYIVNESEFEKAIRDLQDNDRVLNNKMRKEINRIEKKKKEYDAYNKQVQFKLSQYGKRVQNNVNWEMNNIDSVSRMYRYHNLCKQYYDNNDYLYALIFAEKKLDLGLQILEHIPVSRMIDNYLDAANCAFEFGDYDKALKYIDAIKESNHPGYYEILGKILFYRNRVNESIEMFKRSFAINEQVISGLSLVECNFIMNTTQENSNILNTIYENNGFSNDSQRHWYAELFLANQFYQEYIVPRIQSLYEVQYKRRGGPSETYKSDYYNQYLWRTSKGDFLANFHYKSTTRNLRAIEINSVAEEKFKKLEIWMDGKGVWGSCLDMEDDCVEAKYIPKKNVKIKGCIF